MERLYKLKSISLSILELSLSIVIESLVLNFCQDFVPSDYLIIGIFCCVIIVDACKIIISFTKFEMKSKYRIPMLLTECWAVCVAGGLLLELLFVGKESSSRCGYLELFSVIFVWFLSVAYVVDSILESIKLVS